jgi:hypothetical protein
MTFRRGFASSVFLFIFLCKKFGKIEPRKGAKLVEFTLGKQKKSKIFPISLLENREILPGKKKKKAILNRG